MVLEADILLSLLKMPEIELMVETSHHETLYLNNLNQMIWSEESVPPEVETPVTKRQVIIYYAKVLSALMPFLKGQPMVPLLYPNGIAHDYFYPIFNPQRIPSFVHVTVDVDSGKNVVLLDNAETLFYLLNLGTVTLECPIKQCMTLQLYAKKGTIPFQQITTLALIAKDILEKEHVESFIKPFQFTHLEFSPSKHISEWYGLDIVIPSIESFAHRKSICQEIFKELSNAPISINKTAIGLRCQYQDALLFAQSLQKQLLVEPTVSTIEVLPEVVSPYSLMACSIPLVSVPIRWNELTTEKGIPDYWTFTRVLEDLENRQHAWDGFPI